MRKDSLKNKKRSLLAALILLTCIAILTQVVIQIKHFCVAMNLLQTWHSTTNIAFPIFIQHAQVIWPALFGFAIMQLAISLIYILLVWYLAVTVGELFRLRWIATYTLGLAIWLIGALTILMANTYFIHHSFFTIVLKQSIFHSLLTQNGLLMALKVLLAILTTLLIASQIRAVIQVYKNQHRIRHALFMVFFLIVILCIGYKAWVIQPKQVATSENLPNIIIIGLDALRPDCIDTGNVCGIQAPNIQRFLQSTIRFSHAYTPLSKTFPSWTALLTSQHPLHTQVRDNNSDPRIAVDIETLPKRMQQLGYQTIYATDDRRYNNVDKAFGFDEIIGPPGGINDFLIGEMNDFPLSNLLVMTLVGDWLFPYNFANHSVSITYNPNNFLELLAQALDQRKHQPLFLAVHFNSSGFPFLIYNDDQIDGYHFSVDNYKNAVEKADDQFGKFILLLNENHLLDHTMLFFISDHGISLGLRGDKIISSAHYQGDTKKLKSVVVQKYHDAPAIGANPHKDYGIDTSYGYGGDVLSLTQNHTLFAYKTFGLSSDNPHIVSAWVSLMDIAPTLLDLLRQPSFSISDGISLKKYLMPSQEINTTLVRPFYLETSGLFSGPETDTENISPWLIWAKAAKLLNIDPDSGLLYLDFDKVKKQQGLSKEHAVIEGDWMLAQYPPHNISAWSHDNHQQQIPLLYATGVTSLMLKEKSIPGYWVLVNLKTREWTMEWNTSLAKQAPLKQLIADLNAYYREELDSVFSPNST